MHKRYATCFLFIISSFTRLGNNGLNRSLREKRHGQAPHRSLPTPRWTTRPKSAPRNLLDIKNCTSPFLQKYAHILIYTYLIYIYIYVCIRQFQMSLQKTFKKGHPNQPRSPWRSPPDARTPLQEPPKLANVKNYLHIEYLPLLTELWRPPAETKHRGKLVTGSNLSKFQFLKHYFDKFICDGI